jgi:hypothetical protein
MNGTDQSLETDPHIYGHLVFDKDAEARQWRKHSLSTMGLG